MIQQVVDLVGSLEPSLLKLPTDYPRPPSAEKVKYLSTGKFSVEKDLSSVVTLYATILSRYTCEESFLIANLLSNSSIQVIPVQINNSDCQYSQLQSSISQRLSEVPAVSVEEYVNSKINGTIHATFGANVDEATLNSLRVDFHVAIEGSDIIAHYREDLFSIERVEELCRQIQHATTQLSDESISIFDISLVTPQSASTLPVPDKPLDTTWEGSVVHYLSKQARETPNNVALVDARDTITYGELNAVANQFSRQLLQKGLKRQEIVAIFGHRSMPIVNAIASILKCGATFTIIDPAYPADRIIECLKVADPHAVILIEQIAHLIPKSVEEYISNVDKSNRINFVALIKKTKQMIEELKDVPSNDLTSDEMSPEIGPDDVAVLTFTSGSTGIPKGVQGRHGPLTHYYPFMRDHFGYTSQEHFSMQSGISHDPLQRDIFTPWFLGARLYIPDPEDIVNPGRLAEWFAENEITISHLTPAMGQLLTSAAATNSSVSLPKLKYAYFVGDVLTKKFVERMCSIAPIVQVINLYGSTETQRSVTFYMVPRPSEPTFAKLKDILPIGTGMKDVQSLVLSRFTKKFQLAGIGEMGEIYMRSPHLSLGYKGKIEETAEKFIVNPFLAENPDRMYKTGDLGRYLPSGDAECSGRADDQIKIRGFRIELGEINTALVSHPYVKESVTIVRTDMVPNSDEKRLVSYFVFDLVELNKRKIEVNKKTIHVLLREIRQHLRSKVPEYMIPSVFMPLEAIPLTPNGKIKHAALPRPPIEDDGNMTDEENEEDDEGYVAPSGKLEKQLAKIWSEVIGVSRIGAHDNFFDLGGHSISATTLTLKARMTIQGAENLPAEVLFQAPTIRAMAVAIEQLRKGNFATSKADPNRLTRTATAEPIRDLFADTHLDPDIKPTDENEDTPESNWINPSTVLLTGVTGFLGAFILGDLLLDTDAKIYCFVRANNDEDGKKRIYQSLQSHILMWQRTGQNDEKQLTDEIIEQRIVAVVGDLAKPRLGLSEEKFNFLADEIDVIIHNGALVHWMYPYEKLKAPNVDGTREILRLACKGKKLAPVHYVSTTSVFDSDSYSKWTDVLEDCDLPYHEDLKGGYAQSKYVAERLVMNAKRRGLPACIYRPGYVTGHSLTGVWNPDDFLCRMIKGCIQLGSYPDLPQSKLDMSPVNFCSRAITNLFRNRKSLRIYQAYHLVNPTEFFFNSLFETAIKLGYTLEKVSYPEWKNRLYQSTVEKKSENTDKDENALYPMITHFSDDYERRMTEKRPWYDNQNTLKALNETGITCPSVVNLMTTYYKFLCQCGFLQLPENPSDLALKHGFTQSEITQSLAASNTGDASNSYEENPKDQSSLIKSLMRNNKL